MLTYTATDLVELIRRDMEAAAAKPRIHTARSADLVQQIRQRLALGRSTPR
jgi:hypothetical protein